ncbi:MAG: flagellar motor switch protein FliG [Treponema sp.]|nr:flagellar motor switch protein FliG [Treponema sp.]
MNDYRLNAYKSAGNSESFQKATADEITKKANTKVSQPGLTPTQGFVKGAKGEKESVYRRVAKFLMIIGEDQAAKVIPHLSEDELSKIIPEIASIRSISNDEKTVILAEFQELLENTKTQGGVGTAKEILERAFGKRRAQEMLDSTVPDLKTRPFDYLKTADNEKIYNLLKDEHVGTQAIVLSHLESKKAAAIINSMKTDEKRELVLRMAKMTAISPEVVERLNKAMKEKFDNFVTEKTEKLDGRNALAEILKKMSAGAEKDLLSALSDDDPELSDDLKSRLFTMDDVIHADDKFIQKKLADMANSDIVHLIAGKSENFREKILSNVSINRRSQILDDEDTLKPFSRAEVDRITDSFVRMLRAAYDAGDLFIAGRNDEAYI